MHVREPRAFGWLDRAQHHIDACEVFATEFDFADADQTILAQVLTMDENAPLNVLLKPGVWKSLEYYSRKKLGLPAANLRHQHPMTVAATLTGALMQETTPASLDETLWLYARSQGKPTTGVETFAEQVATLRQIPFEAHLKNLTWLLKNYGRQKRRLRKMLARYEAGDIGELYQAAKKDAKGLRKVLLYDRNALMASRFADIARERSLFCAVGAGHLAGEKGLLRLLKKAGFKVRPVL